MTKFSDDVTQGPGRSAARAMLRAVGLSDDDFNKFQVGIVSAGSRLLGIPRSRLKIATIYPFHDTR